MQICRGMPGYWNASRILLSSTLMPDQCVVRPEPTFIRRIVRSENLFTTPELDNLWKIYHLLNAAQLVRIVNTTKPSRLARSLKLFRVVNDVSYPESRSHCSFSSPRSFTQMSSNRLIIIFAAESGVSSVQSSPEIRSTPIERDRHAPNAIDFMIYSQFVWQLSKRSPAKRRSVEWARATIRCIPIFMLSSVYDLISLVEWLMSTNKTAAICSEAIQCCCAYGWWNFPSKFHDGPRQQSMLIGYAAFSSFELNNMFRSWESVCARSHTSSCHRFIERSLRSLMSVIKIQIYHVLGLNGSPLSVI
ncbi:hypothetical protein TNCV_40041 [Trichonephila clavipes]|nr:hypothetical protein TNCV_40041 [Trichonephila clavipes]